jgi:3-dehydroquinate synthase
MNNSLNDPIAHLIEGEDTNSRAFVGYKDIFPEGQLAIDSPNNVFRMPCNYAKHYDVFIVGNLLDQNSSYLLNLLKDRRTLLVTTPTVHSLYADAFNCLAQRHNLAVSTAILNCNEENKSLELVKEVCDQALAYNLRRKDVLVALGGGICSDVVTVAASLIRRGISHIRIPTTLVGQVDAGVGIKGAVNFQGKKSYLGAFCPPSVALIDPTFLKTLPPQHLRNGLAEIIKIAILRDAELLDLIDNHSEILISTGFQRPEVFARRIIWMAVRSMLEELQPNLYEDQTYQRLVDMGHTFSPVIEAASGFTVLHGEAVAIDIALSTTISLQLGLLSKADHRRIISSITSAGLPIFSKLVTRESCLQALKESASHRGGAVNLVLPTKIGGATFLHSIDDLPIRVLDDSIEYLAKTV